MPGICTSSLDRKEEWKRCCAESMGFEWVDCFDDDDENDTVLSPMKSEIESNMQVTNLLDDNDNEHDFEDYYCNYRDEDDRTHRRNQKGTKSSDTWTDNALRIQADLNRMSQWIQSKKREYVGLDMKDEEAGLIQSTVTSFAATTASDLETLRNMISTNTATGASNYNLANHRAGVVQILFSQLQEQVTKPFASLQKQRTREAVQLWQNPLQCKLYYDVPKQSRQGQQEMVFNDDDEGYGDEQPPKEQRFLPQRSYQQNRSDNRESDGDFFISKYANKPKTSIPSTKPDFLRRLTQRQYPVRDESDSSSTVSPSTDERKRTFSNPTTDNIPSSFGDNVIATEQTPEGFQSSSQGRHDVNPDLYRQQLEEDLRTESVQLTTTLIASNDLDSVHQMEKRMVEITTLIGQFSNLVQEQQEQVLQVHESAKETKDNMDKGQENLIDAAERTKKSKHYKAWSILAMAAILVFFHLVRN